MILLKVILNLVLTISLAKAATVKVDLNVLEPITTEDILAGVLNPKTLTAEWVEDEDNQMRITVNDSIVLHNVETGDSRVLVNFTQIKSQLPAGSSLQENLSFSKDGRFALVPHQDSNIAEGGYPAVFKYDILDVQSGKLISKLNPSGWGDAEEQASIQFVEWAPEGNGIVFIYNYDIYYVPSATNSDNNVRLTSDGGDGEDLAIYNGIPDWTFDGYGLDDSKAVWFTKSGKGLAYLKFNETEVGQYRWPVYGRDKVYPEWRKLRYAKAGTVNAQVTLHTVDFGDGKESFKTGNIQIPKEFAEDPLIVYKVELLTDDSALVGVFTRNQSTLHWLHCQIPGSCPGFHKMEEPNGFIDVNYKSLMSSKSGESFLFYENIFQSEEIGSYRHIVKIEVPSGNKTVITDGRMYVDEILEWDQENHKIYFEGTFWNGSVADPGEYHIYSVDDDGQRSLNCLTCDLTNAFGKKCRKNTAKFSKNFTYFIHNCEGPDTPMSTTRLTSGGAQVDNPGPSLVANTELESILSTKALPDIKEYSIPVGEKNFFARARLFIPPGATEGDKFPLLVYVYSGSTDILLDQAYVWDNDMNWHVALASSSKAVVALIDGRGTPKQSSEFLFEVHRRVGTVEMDDQISVTKWLTENVPLIDKEKVAVTGHSYGGFSTIRILERDTENLFKCGIALAPVSNYRFYFTGYTERLMGLPTPEDNLEGYKNADATSPEAVENLRNKTFIIIHGTADYNVHFQNSMTLAKALQEADILFYEMTYPDEDHDLNKPKTRRHLLHLMEAFLFKQCFNS